MEVEPYYKKPKISEHQFEVQEFYPPKSFSIYSTRNILWTVGKKLFPNDVPIWHGWNAQRKIDINP